VGKQEEITPRVLQNYCWEEIWTIEQFSARIGIGIVHDIVRSSLYSTRPGKIDPSGVPNTNVPWVVFLTPPDRRS
jgi:hypothetical protein